MISLLNSLFQLQDIILKISSLHFKGVLIYYDVTIVTRLHTIDLKVQFLVNKVLRLVTY